jgi:hypothetical protein
LAAPIRALIVVGLIGFAFAPALARADEQADRDACMKDAQTHCSQFFPDRERVAHCLQSNRRVISKACRVALSHFKEHR